MNKRFPLQASKDVTPGPKDCAWSIAEKAYANYVKRFGSSQSLERLAERGGFSWWEMDDQYPDWRKEVTALDGEGEKA